MDSLEFLFLTDIFRYGLGAIFVYASVGKLLNNKVFIATVIGYQVLPAYWSRQLGLVLPWIELLIGFLLLAGLFTRIASFTALVLLIVFIMAIAINLRRGRKDLNCGCLGNDHSHRIGFRTLARNVALTLIALWLTLTYTGSDTPTLAMRVQVAGGFVLDYLLDYSGLPLSLCLVGISMIILLIRQLQRFAQTGLRK